MISAAEQSEIDALVNSVVSKMGSRKKTSKSYASIMHDVADTKLVKESLMSSIPSKNKGKLHIFKA